MSIGFKNRRKAIRDGEYDFTHQDVREASKVVIPSGKTKWQKRQVRLHRKRIMLEMIQKLLHMQGKPS